MPTAIAPSFMRRDVVDARRDGSSFRSAPAPLLPAYSAARKS